MLIERTCVYCGELFTVKYPGSKKRFCGRACSNTQKNKTMEWTHERKSKISKANTGRLSGANNPNWRGGPLLLKCSHCGISFELPKYKLNRQSGTFCSMKCFREYEQLNKTPNGQSKLNNAMKGAVRRFIKEHKAYRRWTELVGYSLDDLVSHIESRFKTGMTWDNYGDWHIDHVRPVSSFRFNSFGDLAFKQCWDLSNLQPLWASENISKGDKYVTCCLGADPGSKGAMFAIYSTGDIEHIDFKNASDLDIYHFVSLVSLACDELIVGMENVHSQPEDGVKQAFTFGGHVYRIKTILNLAGIEFSLIQPQKWMNYMGWGRIPHGKENYDKRKKVLLEIAKELTDYKHLSLENADAFLIATYIQLTKNPS